MVGIYKIVNIVNNKIYIGASKDIERRWREHKCELKSNRHCNQKLQNDYNIYGEDKFAYEIIEECTEDCLYDLEIEYIRKEAFHVPELSYNETLGGIGGIPTESTRKKLSENHADVSGKNNPMYGVPSPMTGKHHTEEVRKKMSEKTKDYYKNNPSAMKGENNSRALKLICVYPDGTKTKSMYQKKLAEYLGISVDTIKRIRDSGKPYKAKKKGFEHLKGIIIIEE